ncbi:hypothetical protein O6H91_04G094300 [Diphasiastrum complanatum]|uniref:Uncharacterized protein n=3 Tax=Diphasiastrum complanatum TaxID=34168 RepID=A0ACC2DZQ5_DIPCM|nr:hypothetical protein O6H91_Y197600 [Diphasiastrum complanatum]KAJ7559628.1 hypothetical protein O6H91_04G094300 [Diphasiastrum complanatum]KAJ7559629.1 hypothetical protein O6H91_04G094300 [Diphasiastrum complanatum]KAJ7559630.1 hypothetical protein O6H91_04G094300 [Diphasiastrum complanatum]
MSVTDEYRCFVGGLSWNITDRGLEDTFRKFGRVLEAKVMVNRDTGRSRGFGFVSFADEDALDEAIERLHGKELDGRLISVTIAKPKAEGEIGVRDYGNGYRKDGGRGTTSGSDCFKCGRSGHWARDCSNDRSHSSYRDRYTGGRGDRYSDYEKDRDHYYGKSSSGRRGDRDDYYEHNGDRYSGYVDRESRRDRERYSSSSYRDRSGPYDRPSRDGGRRSSYDRN